MNARLSVFVALVGGLSAGRVAPVAPSHDPPSSPALRDAAPVEVTPPGLSSPSEVLLPSAVVAWKREVRSVATCGGFGYVASRGGVERIDLATRAVQPLGAESGLDSLDVRRVACGRAGGLAVETAFSRCTLEGTRFACHAAPPSAAMPSEMATLDGMSVSSRAALPLGGALVGTTDHGAFFESSAAVLTPVSGTATGALSFATSLAPAFGRIFLGTFGGGLAVVKGTLKELARDPSKLASAIPLEAPFRMVNELLPLRGGLLVGANEGLFLTRDGERFERVTAVPSRAVTGLAARGDALYVTTTSALYELSAAALGARPKAWWSPAGSRSVQGLVLDADADGGWLATEDRGVVRFDAKSMEFRAFDRLAGLPSSWIVGLTSDGGTGVYAATLRDGLLHVDASGVFSQAFSLTGPALWTLGVSRSAGQLCVATQGGAYCGDEAALLRGDARGTFLRGLPDPRVHAVVSIEGARLALTEAGIAVYPGAS